MKKRFFAIIIVMAMSVSMFSCVFDIPFENEPETSVATDNETESNMTDNEESVTSV